MEISDNSFSEVKINTLNLLLVGWSPTISLAWPSVVWLVALFNSGQRCFFFNHEPFSLFVHHSDSKKIEKASDHNFCTAFVELSIHIVNFKTIEI